MEIIQLCFYFAFALKKYLTNYNRMTNTSRDLTVREREVLKYLVQGLSSREIAEKLYISINTVQYHRKQLLHKTNSRNVAELIGKTYKLNLIDLD